MPALKCMSVQETARYLAISPETLKGWRRQGMGPAYYRLPNQAMRGQTVAPKRGGVIVYPVHDLEIWLKQWLVAAARLPQPRRGNQAGVKFPNRKPRAPGSKTGGRPRKVLPYADPVESATAPQTASPPSAITPDDFAALEATVASLRTLLAQHGIPHD